MIIINKIVHVKLFATHHVKMVEAASVLVSVSVRQAGVDYNAKRVSWYSTYNVL